MEYSGNNGTYDLEGNLIIGNIQNKQRKLEVKALEGFLLYIKFKNGEERIYDKLDEKNGAKVSVACKGYGKYTVDGEEVIINKDITIEVMVSVIDMVPAFKRGEPTTTN